MAYIHIIHIGNAYPERIHCISTTSRVWVSAYRDGEKGEPPYVHLLFSYVCVHREKGSIPFVYVAYVLCGCSQVTSVTSITPGRREMEVIVYIPSLNIKCFELLSKNYRSIINHYSYRDPEDNEY